MDSISIRCKSCQHAMKFSADKVGKKAKCPKCGNLIVVQIEEEPKPEPEAPPSPKNDFDDDGPASYGVMVDPELEAIAKARAEEYENPGKKKKERKALPKVARKVKAIPDADSWIKVRIGLMFMSIGCWIWLASHLLQGSYVLLGSIDFPEYGLLIRNTMEKAGIPERAKRGEFPPPGQGWQMNRLNIYLEMIAGNNIVPFAKFALITATVIYFFQAILWMAGYGFCMAVPRRFGMFGQVLIMMGLALINLLFVVVFKLLPVLGFGIVLIPYLTPEISMTVYNMERLVPIHVMWSRFPFWENFLVIFAKFLYYLEPTFGAILIWSIGVTLKSTELAKWGQSLTTWSLGSFFVLLAFHLLSLCGGSPVMVLVLRVIYALWFFFLILFMLRYAMLLMKCRAILDEKINPKNELAE